MVPSPDVDWLDASLDRRAARSIAWSSRRTPAIRSARVLDRLVGMSTSARPYRRCPWPPGHPSARSPGPARWSCPRPRTSGALLRELREQRRQLAVVADEYGGTAGIVRSRTSLEEIVGELEDEYDLPDATLERVDDHTFLVAGSMTIDDFNETVGTQLPHDGARTMAGLAFTALGRRPEEGDSVTVESFLVSIDQIDGLRIEASARELGP